MPSLSKTSNEDFRELRNMSSYVVFLLSAAKLSLMHSTLSKSRMLQAKFG